MGLQNERACQLQIGKALIECKALIDHGDFGPWLRETFTMTQRTAQRYMALARNVDRLCASYSLDATALSHLPMDAVNTLANAPANTRDLLGEALRGGFKPTETQIYDTLFKRVSHKAARIDGLDSFSETLDEFTRDSDVDVARQAVALLVERLDVNDFAKFKALHRQSGVMFDHVLHGEMTNQ